MSAGTEAKAICSSFAYSKVLVARVSKLNGRKIKVRGSSFSISIKTKIKTPINIFFKTGKFTFKKVIKGPDPMLLEDSSKPLHNC